MFEFTIYLDPKTKKNSQQMGMNKYTGKLFLTQSKIYKQYEKDCLKILPKIDTIECPVNLQCSFYRKRKGRVDLVGLLQAIQDILVKAEILKDDNSKIVASTDGSRVFIDKENPRTEIIITRIKEVNNGTCFRLCCKW